MATNQTISLPPKFGVVRNPLLKERQAKKMEPLPASRSKYLKRYLKESMLNATDDGLYSKEGLKAIRAKSEYEGVEKRVQDEYLQRFNAFLLGRMDHNTDGKKNAPFTATPGWENRNTSLLRSHPEVKEYIFNQHNERAMFDRWIQVQEQMGTAVGYDPETGEYWAPMLEDYHMYFKFILEGAAVHDSFDSFLEEFSFHRTKLQKRREAEARAEVKRRPGNDPPASAYDDSMRRGRVHATNTRGEPFASPVPDGNNRVDPEAYMTNRVLASEIHIEAEEARLAEEAEREARDKRLELLRDSEKRTLTRLEALSTDAAMDEMTKYAATAAVDITNAVNKKTESLEAKLAKLRDTGFRGQLDADIRAALKARVASGIERLEAEQAERNKRLIDKLDDEHATSGSFKVLARQFDKTNNTDLASMMRAMEHAVKLKGKNLTASGKEFSALAKSVEDVTVPPELKPAFKSRWETEVERIGEELDTRYAKEELGEVMKAIRVKPGETPVFESRTNFARNVKSQKGRFFFDKYKETMSQLVAERELDWEQEDRQGFMVDERKGKAEAFLNEASEAFGQEAVDNTLRPIFEETFQQVDDRQEAKEIFKEAYEDNQKNAATVIEAGEDRLKRSKEHISATQKHAKKAKAFFDKYTDTEKPFELVDYKLVLRHVNELRTTTNQLLVERIRFTQGLGTLANDANEFAIPEPDIEAFKKLKNRLNKDEHKEMSDKMRERNSKLLKIVTKSVEDGDWLEKEDLATTKDYIDEVEQRLEADFVLGMEGLATDEQREEILRVIDKRADTTKNVHMSDIGEARELGTATQKIIDNLQKKQDAAIQKERLKVTDAKGTKLLESFIKEVARRAFNIEQEARGKDVATRHRIGGDAAFDAMDTLTEFYTYTIPEPPEPDDPPDGGPPEGGGTKDIAEADSLQIRFIEELDSDIQQTGLDQIKKELNVMRSEARLAELKRKDETEAGALGKRLEPDRIEELRDTEAELESLEEGEADDEKTKQQITLLRTKKKTLQYLIDDANRAFNLKKIKKRATKVEKANAKKTDPTKFKELEGPFDEAERKKKAEERKKKAERDEAERKKEAERIADELKNMEKQQAKAAEDLEKQRAKAAKDEANRKEKEEAAEEKRKKKEDDAEEAAQVEAMRLQHKMERDRERADAAKQAREDRKIENARKDELHRIELETAGLRKEAAQIDRDRAEKARTEGTDRKSKSRALVSVDEQDKRLEEISSVQAEANHQSKEFMEKLLGVLRDLLVEQRQQRQQQQQQQQQLEGPSALVIEDITRVLSGLADGMIRQIDLTTQQIAIARDQYAIQYRTGQLQLQQGPLTQQLALILSNHTNVTSNQLSVLNQTNNIIQQPPAQQSSLSRPTTDPQSSLPAANTTRKRPIEPDEGTESPTKKLKVDGETLSPAEARKVSEDQVVLGAIEYEIEPREDESLEAYIKRLYPRSEPEKRKEYIGALTHGRAHAATMEHIREQINKKKKEKK